MNVWIFTGRLTKQPVSKQVGNNMVYNFSVAINKGKDKDPIYAECDWWGDRGKYITSFDKGSLVTVHGELSPRKWTTKDGVEKTVLGCRVNDVSGLAVTKAERVEQEARPEPEAVEEPEEDEIPF